MSILWGWGQLICKRRSSVSQNDSLTHIQYRFVDMCTSDW